MGRKPILSLAEIEPLMRQGMTQKQIAEIMGVSRQAVSKFIGEHGEHLLTPRQVVAKHFPWRVPNHLLQVSPYKRMRDHGEWFETNGEGMSPEKLQRLRWWYRYIRNENVVLEFDPDIAPEPGVSNKGGFAYRPRVASDGKLLFRVNRHTKEMTPEMHTIWELPEPEDQP
ncbi:helix-turn-helix domain-containing protein [Nocardia vulneris]|uniref:helix-turn-helix domain-containing protein n=1 Tax=Nocardia vulneris TaxID=1141657 RepID=UPI0005B7A52D|nr:helix-turn-helix transcriptional regulator [Nocardia vulneris]